MQSQQTIFSSSSQPITVEQLRQQEKEKHDHILKLQAELAKAFLKYDQQKKITQAISNHEEHNTQTDNTPAELACDINTNQSLLK